MRATLKSQSGQMRAAGSPSLGVLVYIFFFPLEQALFNYFMNIQYMYFIIAILGTSSTSRAACLLANQQMLAKTFRDNSKSEDF